MTTAINEDVVEQAALAWLEQVGKAVSFGGDIALGEPATLIHI